MRFTPLASGSRGNACLIRSGDIGLLIDLGLGPRGLAGRLADAGSGWESIASVLLTHTHGDHVKPDCFRRMIQFRIPLYCHAAHRKNLRNYPTFTRLDEAGLVREYDDRPWLAPGGFRVEAIAASHDDEATHGFRIEARERRWHPTRAVGYLADTGCWNERQVEALADANILAIEFNHDVELQRRSGRPPFLISRILGDFGHLSNDQGAALAARVLSVSRPNAVKALVLLHMSEQCNLPDLALAAAREAIRRSGRRLTARLALQDRATESLSLESSQRSGLTIRLESQGSSILA